MSFSQLALGSFVRLPATRPLRVNFPCLGLGFASSILYRYLPRYST